MATRGQRERDATTVEIAYAFVTAMFLAGVTGLVLATPVFLLDLHGTAMKAVTGTALVLAGGVLVWRLVSVLWRYDDARGR